MEKLRKYQTLRSNCLKEISTLGNLSRTALTDKTVRTLFKVRYSDLPGIYDEFIRNHNNIIAALLTDANADVDAEYNTREGFLGEYYQIKAAYADLFEENQARDSIAPTTFTNPTRSNVRLPRIELPKFNGDYTTFSSFIDLFNALVHDNPDIVDIEKFNYLVSSLQGPPLRLVRTLPLTSDNYVIAYNTLIERFSNKRCRAQAHWAVIENSVKLATENVSDLRKLLDTFTENLSALKTLGFPTDSWDFILFTMLSQRLDKATLTRFEMKHDSVEIPTYATLVEFLNSHCIVLETLSLSATNVDSHKKTIVRKPDYKPPAPALRTSATTSLFVNKSPSTACAFCKANHSLYTCSVFAQKTPTERYNICKSLHLCFNCLSGSHDLRSCRSSAQCRKCSSKKHHTLLCFDKHNTRGHVSENAIPSSSTACALPIESEIRSVANENVVLPAQPGPSNLLVGAGIVAKQSRTVLLATALVDVCDSKGSFHSLRCLLDSGSMTSFISKRAVSRLSLRQFDCSTELKGLGSMTSSVNRGVTLTIKPIRTPSPILITDAIILEKICDPMPTSNISNMQWSHLAHLPLADPHFAMPGPIDILIGADLFSKIVLNERIYGADGEPDALNSIFGYILTGKINLTAPPSLTSLFCASHEPSLETTMQQFWTVENVPSPVSTLSPDEETCENIFLKTYSRDATGRYTVSLPFKFDRPVFSNFRQFALNRFYALERRLLKHPELYLSYSDFMREYLTLNHMEPISPTCNISDNSYYLIHHCVLKPESTTTKLRVVFNGSAKLPGQMSLNDCLFIGPKLQQDLVAILLNFRLYAFALCADIKQMYRMILVEESHRDYQRILWRFSPDEPVCDYRLNTVTYGVNCAPYLALRTLLQLADDEGSKYPVAAAAIRQFSYIDDFCCSAPTFAAAQTLISELSALMKLGRFELRKWSSNNTSLLCDLPSSHVSMDPLTFHDNSDFSVKVLGLQWNPASDYLFFSVQPLPNRPCTKRMLLSELARVYDPLGFLSPVIFYTKYLIQRLWLTGIGWDENPPSDIARAWAQYKSELPLLSDIRIPRCILSSKPLDYELHGFCDASERGYASVVYLRVFHPDNSVSLHFLCGKSKVAPIKTISIPRLELCAAVLLAQLLSYVMHVYAHRLDLHKLYAWSDSQIVLAWVRSQPHRFKTFVANRISYIQSKTPLSSWCYINTFDNPADVASRGILPRSFTSCHLWFQGPSFLYDNAFASYETPNLDDAALLSISGEEKKLVLLNYPPANNFLHSLLDEKSSFSQIQRITAYVLRFLHNARSERCFGPLTSSELYNATLALVKFTQHLHFSDELNSRRFSKPLRKLSVFLDSNSILRVGGRLKHANLTYETKYPILLPCHSRFTSLIIDHFHQKYFHTGPRATQYLLSQQFWILSFKRAINSRLTKCIQCYKSNPKCFQPSMGNLPTARVTQTKPFSHSAVDFGGPFLITPSRHRGIKTIKAYICVFVCFATKAVHIELASDLTAEIFLAALQRFIARRGRVSTLYSDNATNFVSAAKQLSLMKDAAARESIEFTFSPPGGPNFNGLCEAGIKSVKKHLSKVIGAQILTYEEFYTILTLIESILNSRPLTPMTSDVNDFTALTPGHFLTLEPVSALSVPDYSTTPMNRLSRWQLLQRLHRDFWKRWHLEYLNTMQQREKWLKHENPPKIGTLVLIRDNNAPPTQWKLGRLVILHPGDDGITRVATVKTQSGTLKRPLNALSPLPVD